MTYRGRHPTLRLICSVSFISLAALSGCHRPNEPNSENFSAGLKTYLARNGKLCLGKFDWPVSVAPSEEQAHSRDAIQMPVLQKLGLVSEREAVVQYKDENKNEAIAVKQYALTKEGHVWFTNKPPPSVTSDGRRVAHTGDLCIANLTLDKVVGWEPPHLPSSGGEQQTTVTYTYKINAAPWTTDPDAIRAFPMVAQVIQGAGTLQLQEVFTLTKEGWVAADLL